MCRLAVDGDGKLILAGRLERCRACMTVRIERIAEVGVQEARIEAARAVDAALLGDGKDNLQIAVRDVLLLQLAQGLKDGDNARLVIRTEDGCAVGADHAVPQARLDVCARLDAVHMCREHDGGRARDRALEICDDVAAVAAKRLSCVVLVDLCCAEVTQMCGQEIAHLALIERRTADGDEREELIQYAFFVNHMLPSFRGKGRS